MTSLYDYICEHLIHGEIFESSSPISDNAIWYRLGIHKFLWPGSKPSHEKWIKKYNISKSDPRPGIIRMAKDIMVKPLKSEQEVIGRKKWDLDGLIGESEKQLLHPDYWTMQQYIYDVHKRKHDVLTIFECSNAKPYSTQSIVQKIFLEKYDYFTDFACISNPGIIPMEFSHFYPYRYDEWDHYAEEPDIAQKYCDVNIARVLHYVKKMGYKHVLVVMQNDHPQTLFNQMVKSNVEDCNEWLHIVTNDNFRKEYHKKMDPKFGRGLAVQRMQSSPLLRDRYQKVLHKYIDKSREDDWKELMEILDKLYGDEKSSGRRELEEWREKRNLVPYDTSKGKVKSFKRMSPDSNVESSKVDAYIKFIEKYCDELEDRIKKAKSSEEYHKNIAFTVLDLLLLYWKDKTLKDPDTEYWNMKAALNKYKNEDIVGLKDYDYCYYFKSGLDQCEIKEDDLLKSLNKLQVIQLNRAKEHNKKIKSL